MMKIKHVIENDIVENISIYKHIYESLIELIRQEIQPNYEPSFTFNEFCAKMINNFEGIDEDINDYSEIKGNPLTTKLLNSLMKITMDEFKDDEESSEKIAKIIKNI